MIIRRMIKEAMESYFMEESIDYFIGGSEMFGWANRESDIDFFISCCNDQLVDIFKEFPAKTIMNNNVMSGYDDNVSAQYSLLGGLIHLNVFINSLPSYELLKDEHKRVEKLLNNYDLKKVLTILKCNTPYLRGRDIYNALKRL